MTNCSLLYYKLGDLKKDNAVGSIYHVLEAMSILRASTLNEIVSIPALNVSTTRSRVSCFVPGPGDNPRIYISSTADPDLAITFLARHISELFDVASCTEQIHRLLVTTETDTLLNDVFQLPPLPDSGDRLMVDDSEIATDLFEDAMEDICYESQPLSDEPEEMEGVMMEAADAACQVEYRALISVVNRDFKERLKDNVPRDRNCTTGFAGELLVVSLRRKGLTLGLSPVGPFAPRLFRG